MALVIFFFVCYALYTSTFTQLLYFFTSLFFITVFSLWPSRSFPSLARSLSSLSWVRYSVDVGVYQ